MGNEIVSEMNLLKLSLGVCLLFVAWILYSIWYERLSASQDEERVRFLFFSFVGGYWFLAILAFCSGCYFLVDPWVSSI